MKLPVMIQKRLDSQIAPEKQEQFVLEAINSALDKVRLQSSQQADRQSSLKVYTDGGARGNPGPGGCGAVIADDQDQIIHEAHRFLGNCTNNQAEYQGLLLALQEVLTHFPTDALEIRSDSELMVKQLNGQYKVKNPELQTLYKEAISLLKKIPKVQIMHIPRHKNKRADELSNLAMDEGTKR